MKGVKIHLPLKDGGIVQVIVRPEGIYNGVSGLDLINRYSKRPYKRKPQPQQIEIKDNKITIPSGKLDKDSIRQIKKIEDSTGLRILNRREPQALKPLQNTTIEINPSFGNHL